MARRSSFLVVVVLALAAVGAGVWLLGGDALDAPRTEGAGRGGERAARAPGIVPSGERAPAPGAGLVVRVLDAAGRPAAGVPVRAHEEVAGVTDERGEVELLTRNRWLRWSKRKPLVVELDHPRADVDRGVPVVVEGSPPAPLELALPKAGRVRVEVGVPVAGASVELAGPRGRTTLPLDAGGAVEFAHVELGVPLEVRLRAPGVHAPARSVSGPRADGETTLVALGLDGASSLRFVLTEGGAPRGGATVAWSFPGGDRGELSTHADGAGRLLVDGGADAWPTSVTLARGDEQAVVDLPAFAAGATVDLGTVELAPAALLAVGRVVDARGRGVEGATVRLHGGAGSRPATTSADGAFALRGAAGPAASWTVVATHPTHGTGRASDVRAGAEGLKLTLGPGVLAHLAVRDGEDHGAGAFTAHLTGADGKTLGSASLASDGFWFERVLAEEATLAVRLARGQGTLEEREVFLRAGPDGVAALGEIVLGQLVQSVQVEVSGRGSGALRGARVVGPGVDVRTDEEGRAVLVLPRQDGLELDVSAPGFAGTKVPVEGAFCIVELLPPARVIVSVVGGELEHEGEIVQLQLVPRTDGGPSETSAVDPESRTATFTAPRPGTYVVRWTANGRTVEGEDEFVVLADVDTEVAAVVPDALWEDR